VHYEDGYVYVGDTFNHAVRRIDVATREVVTLAGTGTAGSTGDGGPATAAQLDQPIGLDLDASGALFVAESGGNVVRRIDADGTISTAAGTGVLGFANGAFGDAQLAGPQDVHVLPDGDVVIVDTFNARVRIAGGLAAPEP
jgi:DNA-binding beta-propeller fold protein YncE